MFTHWHYFSCFVNGLNHVLLICMGSSLGANTICLGCNMGGVNCLNVGDDSQCFSWQRSKSQWSQHIAYAIIWLKVMGLGMVNIRSITSPQNPNWNWFMNTTLSHEMSHVSCMNFKMYTKVGCDPCEKFVTCLLLYPFCLNRQKKHQFFQKMFYKVI